MDEEAVETGGEGGIRKYTVWVIKRGGGGNQENVRSKYVVQVKEKRGMEV